MSSFVRRSLGAIAIIAFAAVSWSLYSANAKDDAASAVTAAAPAIGLIDMNRIMQTANAAKDVFTAIEDKRKEYQGQISKVEDGLRDFETKVMKEKDSLNKDQMEKKRKEFETKMMDAQKMVQEKKTILDQAYAQSMDKLRAEVLKITAEMAQERKLSVIFSQDAVVIGEKELDITDEVLDVLNDKVKKIPVVWSAAKEEKKG
jgi:Skp family chaperone for outer membrane proteins